MNKPREWCLIRPKTGPWAGEVMPVASGPCLAPGFSVPVIEKSAYDALEARVKELEGNLKKIIQALETEEVNSRLLVLIEKEARTVLEGGAK